MQCSLDPHESCCRRDSDFTFLLSVLRQGRPLCSVHERHKTPPAGMKGHPPAFSSFYLFFLYQVRYFPFVQGTTLLLPAHHLKHSLKPTQAQYTLSCLFTQHLPTKSTWTESWKRESVPLSESQNSTASCVLKKMANPQSSSQT